MKPITVQTIMQQKAQQPIVALTAYYAHTAAIVDRYADIILVGDSLGMVTHGMSSTVPVSVDLIILHAQAVARAVKRSLVVVDMPFGSYEESPEMAFRNAVKIMKQTNCTAVKLEGGAIMADTIAFLTQRGIPVMAHIGLLPQSMHATGGFVVQGRRKEDWSILEQDAMAVSRAGAFSVVLEGMVEPLAAKITKDIAIPTIGIGASAECDGQILVLEDMLGFNPKPPRFVKQYAMLGNDVDQAVAHYAKDVRARAFPKSEQIYKRQLEE